MEEEKKPSMVMKEEEASTIVAGVGGRGRLRKDRKKGLKDGVNHRP